MPPACLISCSPTFLQTTLCHRYLRWSLEWCQLLAREHLCSLPVGKDVAGQHMQNPSRGFCVVFGDVAPLREQDVLHWGMQPPMECTCISSDKLTGTRTLPESGKWGFPATRPAFSYPKEPWPGTLLGEITECNFIDISPTQQGAGPITVFTTRWPQQMMMLGKWGLLERAPKKTTKQNKQKTPKKPQTTTKQNWFAYSLPHYPLPAASFHLPHLAMGNHTFAGKSSSPMSPTQACAAPYGQQQPTDRQTHRCTKSNTSTVLSSSLMLKECDSCHLPFPGKAKEGFSHPNLLDPTAKPGCYSRMSSSHEKLPGEGMWGAGSRPTAPQSQCSFLFPIPRNFLAIPAQRRTDGESIQGKGRHLLI